jgi:tetratricopeptide (TPR) repeat protein
LREELARAHPGVVRYRADLARTYNNLGLLQKEANKRAEALEWYGKARELREALARARPDVVRYRADLAATYNNLGILQKEANKRAEALEWYGKARELREALARAQPDVVRYRADLVATYNDLGLLQQRAGQWDEALNWYDKARKLQEDLARVHPEVVRYRADLAATYVNLGNLTRDQDRPADALDWYAKAITVLQRVLDTDPQVATPRLWLRNAYRGRARTLTQLGRHAEAAQDWIHAAEFDAGPGRNFFRLQRAISLAHSGDHIPAVAEANAVAEAKDVQAPTTLYNAACVCALASSSAKQDLGLAEQYASRAVELLRQAVAKGYKNVAHIKKDTDLDGLRGRDDFKTLMAQLEQSLQGERKRGPGQGTPDAR